MIHSELIMFKLSNFMEDGSVRGWICVFGGFVLCLSFSSDFRLDIRYEICDMSITLKQKYKNFILVTPTSTPTSSPTCELTDTIQHLHTTTLSTSQQSKLSCRHNSICWLSRTQTAIFIKINLKGNFDETFPSLINQLEYFIPICRGWLCLLLAIFAGSSAADGLY